MANLRIRELIEESRKLGRRVTQTELAKAAGVTQQTITRIANNQRKRLDPVILQSIAGVFTEALGREITIDDLIEKEGKETPNTSPESDIPSDDPSAEPRTIDDKIDDINEQLEGIRNEIAGVRTEISKLNQRGGVN